MCSSGDKSNKPIPTLQSNDGDDDDDEGILIDVGDEGLTMSNSYVYNAKGKKEEKERG